MELCELARLGAKGRQGLVVFDMEARSLVETRLTVIGVAEGGFGEYSRRRVWWSKVEQGGR